MAMGAMGKYIAFHKAKDALNGEVEAFYGKLNGLIPHIKSIGGYEKVYKQDILNFDCEEFNKVIITRHSIRNFSDEKVDIDLVKSAIELAQHCPSACNRQPTKIHIVGSEDGIKYLSKHLQGVGGFADDCKMFLIVTGCVSAFDFVENNQWLVNAGIFVGILELTLHSKGIASCVVQRPLVRSNRIDMLRNYFDIPDNEEIVCVIGMGMYMDEFCVPVSTRLTLDEIVTVK